MKHTNAMIYKETDESKELTIYAVNCGRLHHSMIVPVIDNLKKKVKRGTYDAQKAVDAFYHVATEASKLYAKEFSNAMDWNRIFDVTARYTCAVEMVDFYEDNIMEG